MSEQPLNDRDLFDFINRFVVASMAGDLTDSELARFEQLLSGNAAARRIYLEHVEASVFLPLIIASLDTPELLPPSEAPPESPSRQGPPSSSVLGFLGGAVDYVNHSRRLMFLLVAAMLSGWFLFQIGSVLLGRWFAGHGQVADQADERPGAAGTKRAGAGPADGADPAHAAAIAWLSGSVSGRWQVVPVKPGAGNPGEPVYWEIGKEFVAGQQVKLVAGLGEITFRSGAKVVLTSPALFSVTSPLETDLQLGKLAARVPHSAIGFTVSAPTGSVVDLGTEFGVEVTPDNKMDVQVFVGEVKVNAPSGGAGNGQAGDPGVRVTAGRTVHCEPGHPAVVVVSKIEDRDRFQRDLKIASDSSDKRMAAYLEMMRGLRPVVWFRMEGKAGDKTIHDEIGNAPDGKLVWDGPGNPFVNGAVGKGLWLRGPELGDGAVVPDYPKTDNGQLSVVAWVYAESRPAWATIAKNWGDQLQGQFLFGLRGSAGDHAIDLHVGFGAGIGDLEEGESHPFPLYSWQHVAFTCDAKMVRLYRQGHEVAAAQMEGKILAPSPVAALGIGVKTDDAGQPSRYHWDGKLDEVAVFNRALSPDEIKRLAAAPPR